MNHDGSAGLVKPNSLVTVPLETSASAATARAARPSPLRQVWFWCYVLTALCAVAFGAFAIHEGFASDAELRGARWTSGLTVTLVAGLVFAVVGVVAQRRATRAAHR